MSDELHTPGYWMTVLRRIRFADARDGVSGAMIKAVATALAGYADFEDGRSEERRGGQVCLSRWSAYH